MKAAVMKSENGTSVILTEDGIFRTIPGSYAVGEEITYSIQSRRRRKGFVAAAVAACLCFAMVTGLWSWQTQMVYATVSLGETLSIEYHLNRLGHVLRVVALEPEAEAVARKLNDHDLRGESLRAAIADTEAILKKDLSGACSKARVKCSSKKHTYELACQLKPAKKPAATDKKPSVTETKPSPDPASEAPSAVADSVPDNTDAVDSDTAKPQETGEKNTDNLSNHQYEENASTSGSDENVSAQCDMPEDPAHDGSEDPAASGGSSEENSSVVKE